MQTINNTLPDKENYICDYLEKKLKNCTLKYGLQYLILVSDLTEKAEKIWNKKLKKYEKHRKTS